MQRISKIMKVVKGKYIRLSESELTSLIKEEVQKELRMIMEHYIPRSKFVEKSADLCRQIIENWCLVHYCTLTGTETNKEHWKDELYAHMDNIGQSTIKGSKDYDMRVKAITEGFGWNDAFNGKEKILQFISKKFQKEGFNPKSAVVGQVAEDCSNDMKNIVHYIANYYNEDIDEYIQKI